MTNDESSICSSAVNNPGRDQNEQLTFAQTENKAVWFLRAFLFLMLLGAAIAVCASVYVFSKDGETKDFEDDFTGLGTKLVQTFEDTFQERMGVIENFAMDLTSFANSDPESNWPFVTLPDYEYRAGSTARLSHLMQLILLPLVPSEFRIKWEDYSVKHQGWRYEGIAIQQGISVEEVQTKVPPIVPYLHYSGERFPKNATGPFIVIWQVFPSIPAPNVNGQRNNSGYRYLSSMELLIESGMPVLPRSNDFIGKDQKDPRRSVFTMYMQVGDYQTKYEDDPYVPMFYPVFDRLGKDNHRKVVAILHCGVYWRTYFRKILPPGANGVLVVLENTCNQQYTYQINGEEAQFVGHGDLHDPKYDYLGIRGGVNSLIGSVSSDGSCLYNIIAYPSQELEDSYSTNNPMFYTIGLAAVFLCTSAVFMIYDYCVERRQKIVMKSAQQSGAVVASLFPEAVRDRLYEEQQVNVVTNTKKNKVPGTWDVGNYDASYFNDDHAHDGAVHRYDKEAIANLYPDCSVLFADIAGFTKWSSTRTPSDVFQLLETIYAAFDKIARKRNVFKIETIGDCYVAVTGLPNPQQSHAVIMARFASDCLSKMKQLRDELVNPLGEDTSHLALRLGFHSGPVTAGVLRGEKSRFQIFGDTVNTAARMESNSIRDKIQVSEASAKCLRVAGKEHWLTRRSELVAAKGKGDMQTYWVDVINSSSSDNKSLAPTDCTTLSH